MGNVLTLLNYAWLSLRVNGQDLSRVKNISRSVDRLRRIIGYYIANGLSAFVRLQGNSKGIAYFAIRLTNFSLES